MCFIGLIHSFVAALREDTHYDLLWTTRVFWPLRAGLAAGDARAVGACLVPGMPCPHGRQRSRCKECGGKGICEHGRQHSQCKDCGGKGICEHGRVRRTCKECGGNSVCEHGRQRSACKECGGGSRVIILEVTAVEELDEEEGEVLLAVAAAHTAIHAAHAAVYAASHAAQVAVSAHHAVTAVAAQATVHATHAMSMPPMPCTAATWCIMPLARVL